MQNIKTKFVEKISTAKEKARFYKNFIVKNFKHISAFLFVLGFVLDYFTLPDVTSIAAVYFGGILMLILGSLIYFRELVETEKINFKNEIKYVSFLSLLITFLLGSYTSFVFVYYIKGGDIISNIPILLLILGLMISNEFIKNKWRLYVDLITYSLATIFYFIFAVPYVFKSVSLLTFIISLIISNLFLYFYLKEIFKLNINILKYKLHNYLLFPNLVLFLIYVGGTFPAVPLSLKYAGLYKDVKVTRDDTSLTYTLNGTINRNIFLNYVVKKSETNQINFYTELQAPDNLTGTVSHIWEYYSESQKKWIQINEIKYNIYGGRSDGYRGYSKITNLRIGDYRIKVILDGKRLAGEKRFSVE